jgi:protein SCO1/2
MNKTSQLLSLVFVVVVIVLGYWYFGGSPNIDKLKQSVAPAASLYPEAKSISASLEFINDQSKEVYLSGPLKGKWGLLYFGFTSCPDVCPVDLAKISQSYKAMKNKDDLQVVFISVDPKRDIGKLDSYAQAFDKSFIGLTTHEDKLSSITRVLGVYHQVVETQQDVQQDHSEHSTDSHDSHDKGSNAEMKSMSSEQYNIDHTTSFLLLSPDLKLTAILTSPHEPKAMAEALDKIIDAL